MILLPFCFTAYHLPVEVESLSDLETNLIQQSMWGKAQF